MAGTHRLRLAPVAFALALAALALLGTGGRSSGALGVAVDPASLDAESALAVADDLPDSAVTPQADERVESRADRWRPGVLLALLAVGLAVPALRGRGAAPGDRRVWPRSGRRASVEARGPPSVPLHA